MFKTTTMPTTKAVLSGTQHRILKWERGSLPICQSSIYKPVVVDAGGAGVLSKPYLKILINIFFPWCKFKKRMYAPSRCYVPDVYHNS